MTSDRIELSERNSLFKENKSLSQLLAVMRINSGGNEFIELTAKALVFRTGRKAPSIVIPREHIASIQISELNLLVSTKSDSYVISLANVSFEDIQKVRDLVFSLEGLA